MSRTLDAGRNEDVVGVIPYIRIHDYVLKKSDIVYFEIRCEDFLPTMFLRIKSPSTTLSDTNKIEDGDLVVVGIRADLGVFRPISVDFLVTDVEISSSGLGKAQGDILNEYFVKGRLNIPNLDTEDIRFSYQGYAEDALKEGAKRIGLGYVENDNPRTPSIKKETWTCYDNVLEFFQNTTRHMWAGKDSFFDSWIDLYLNLVNVNVNDMLGRTIDDDGIMDFTKYRSIIDTAGEDGKYVHNDLDKMSSYMDNKMFCNDKAMQTSVWFVNKYRIINNATRITKKYGIQKNYNIYLQNNGVGQSENDSKYEVGIGVYYNYDKIKLGYVILNGPTGYDLEYKSADNGDWRKQNIRTDPPLVLPVQSDGDEDNRDGGKTNKKTSGNFSKEYVIAEPHNEINLAELEKQNVVIETTGFNNGFAKGEKLPCILYKQSNEKYANPSREIPDNSYMLDAICSGWFYVKSVVYKYHPDIHRSNSVSDWVTETTLTRREWMTPVPAATASAANDAKNASASATPSAESAAKGTSKLNDVGSGATDANNTSTNSTPSNVETNSPSGTQTETSPMEDEVVNNIDGQEKNADAIEAVDSAEKTEESLEETKDAADETTDEKTQQESEEDKPEEVYIFHYKNVSSGVMYWLTFPDGSENKAQITNTNIDTIYKKYVEYYTKNNPNTKVLKSKS